MSIDLIGEIITRLGLPGLIICYLIWRETEERKDKRKRYEVQNKITETEIASRLELSRTLTTLCLIIQGKTNV